MARVTNQDIIDQLKAYEQKVDERPKVNVEGCEFNAVKIDEQAASIFTDTAKMVMTIAEAAKANAVALKENADAIGDAANSARVLANMLGSIGVEVNGMLRVGSGEDDHIQVKDCEFSNKRPGDELAWVSSDYLADNVRQGPSTI